MRQSAIALNRRSVATAIAARFPSSSRGQFLPATAQHHFGRVVPRLPRGCCGAVGSLATVAQRRHCSSTSVSPAPGVGIVQRCVEVLRALVQRHVNGHQQSTTSGDRQEQSGTDHPIIIHIQAFEPSMDTVTLLREGVLAKQPELLENNGHIIVAAALDTLCETLMRLGRLDEAIDVFQNQQLPLLESARPLFPESSLAPYAISGWRRTANILAGRNQCQELLAVSRDHLLPALQSAVGELDPRSILTLQNITICHIKLGQMDIALKLLREDLLPKQRKMVNSVDAHTITLFRHLTTELAAHGRNNEALEILQDVLLPAQRKLLADDHPETLCTLHEVAHNFNALRRHDVALQLLEKDVLPARRRALSDTHPHTLASLVLMADILEQLNRAEDALTLLNDTVLPAQRQALGPDHADTFRTLESIARACYSLKQVERSLTIMQNVLLPAQQRALGAEHAATILTRANIAFCLLSLDRLSLVEVEALRDDLLPSLRRFHGDAHISTLQMIDLIVLRLRYLGHPKTAVKFLAREVVPTFHRALGKAHLTTLASLSELAACLQDCHRSEEAVRILQDQVLPGLCQALGDRHPTTLLCVANTALNLARCPGKCDEALLLLRTHVLPSVRLQASTTPSLLFLCGLGLAAANLSIHGRRHEEALKILEHDLLPTVTTLFGASHWATLEILSLAAVTRQRGELDQ